MPFILISGCTALLVGLCHVRKRSKIFPLLLLLLGVLIVTCCNEGNDFKALKFRYDAWYFIQEFPIGFQWILTGAKNISLSFDGFKLCYAIILYYLLYKFYRKYSIWPAVCCALVFIFPCDSFNGQIRNCISSIIVIYAIMHYLGNESKKSILVFIGLIVLATIIHPSSIIYICALFVRKNISSKTIIIATIVFFFVLTIGFYSGFILKLASMVISDPRVLRWLKVGMFGNMFGSLASAVGHIVWIAYLGYARQFAYPDTDDEVYENQVLSKSIIDRIYNLNLISLTLIPLYFVTHAYFRIFKYILFIDVLVVVQAAFIKRSGRQTLIIVNLALFLGCFLISSMVGVGYRGIPVFYNSFDLSSLSHLFIR